MLLIVFFNSKFVFRSVKWVKRNALRPSAEVTKCLRRNEEIKHRLLAVITVTNFGSDTMQHYLTCEDDAKTTDFLVIHLPSGCQVGPFELQTSAKVAIEKHTGRSDVAVKDQRQSVTYIL